MEKITGVPVLSIIPAIVTPEDKRKKKKRRMILAGTSVGGIFLALLLFHLFVMDLYVFYAKLVRFIQSRFPVG
jgi:uncharacterized protein YybS (DUF2232 family)